MKKKDKEEADKIIYEVAEGNINALKKFFSSVFDFVLLQPKSNLSDNEDTDFAADVSRFIL